MNAQGACNDCHTCPSYASGVAFGPFVSHNITPDDSGLPFGLSFEDFKLAMRKGHDVKDPDPPANILQVMPWPVYMTDHDLRAVYEFLKAIPPAQPGTCAGPGDAAH